MNLHLIMVADTHDDSIGDSVKADANHILNVMGMVAEGVNVPLRKTVIIGADFTKGGVVDAVEGVDPEPEDTVVFWYSGHGYRTSSKADRWPFIAVMPSSYDLPGGVDESWVYETLSAKNPRLLMVFCDCCNVSIEGAAERKVRSRARALSERVRENYKRLFVDAQGTLIAASSEPGEYSYGGIAGGAFTCAFLSSLGDAARKPNASWKQIMDVASRPLPGPGNPSGRQSPIYELDIDGTRAVETDRRGRRKAASASAAVSRSLKGLPGFRVEDYRLFTARQKERLKESGIRTFEHAAAVASTDEGFHALCRLLRVRSKAKQKDIRQALHSIPRAFIARPEDPLMMGCLEPAKSRSSAKVSHADLFHELSRRTYPEGADVKNLALATGIRNQGQRGTCVAFAATKVLETVLHSDGPHSPQYLYWCCKQEDGIPDKSGTYMHVALDVLHGRGCCRELTMPYDGTSCRPEAGRKPGSAAHEEASRYATDEGVETPWGSGTAGLHVLYAKAAVSGKTGLKPRAVFGAFTLFESFANGYTRLTGHVNMPLAGERKLGAHAMAVVGYRDDDEWPGGGYLIVANSWGQGWAGQSPEGAGVCRIPYAYADRYQSSTAVVLNDDDRDEVFTKARGEARGEDRRVSSESPTERFLHAFSYSNWQGIVNGYREWLDWVEKAPAESLADEVERLSKLKLWRSIPSGNRNYMEKALRSRRRKGGRAGGYLEGLRGHLTRAWPNIVASVFSHDPDRAWKGDRALDALGGTKTRIRGVPTVELLDFTEQLVKDRFARKAVQPTNMRTLEGWLRVYRRKTGMEAESYIQEKREKMERLLTKVVLPAVFRKLAAERSRSKKR